MSLGKGRPRQVTSFDMSCQGEGKGSFVYHVSRARWKVKAPSFVMSCQGEGKGSFVSVTCRVKGKVKAPSFVIVVSGGRSVTEGSFRVSHVLGKGKGGFPQVH